MNIVQEKTGDLTANLKVQLVVEDYQSNVEKALKDLQKKAQMPGFRQGKVPMGIVKKMYGKGVLADEVNKVLMDSVYAYIKENNLNILGNPLPDNDKTLEIDWDTQQDFEFYFEIGLAPEINIDFNDPLDVVYHKIQVQDSLVDETIENVRKRNGNYITPELTEDNDVLFGEFAEVEGDGNVIEDGLKNKTNLYIQYIKDAEIKKQLIGLKQGDSLLLDLEKAVENETEMAGMLGVKKEELSQYGKNFQFTIERISRIEPAELNESLFKKVAPDAEIADVDAFKTYLRQQLGKQYQADVDRNFKNDAVKAILERANLQLPVEFLKKWLLESNRDNKEITPEQVENEFVTLQESFKWQLIENYLIKENNLEVKHEEVSEYLKNYMRQQLRQYGQHDPEEEVLNDFVKRIASNQEELKKVYDQLFEVKVIELLKEKLNLQEKEVTFDEFVNEMTEKYKRDNI
jgi:trigger factor